MNDSSPTRPTRSQRIGEALRHPPPGAKTVAIATASTITVLAVVAYVVVNSPGWERAQAAFFDFDVFGERPDSSYTRSGSTSRSS